MGELSADVVVPTYKRPAELIRCLEALARQTVPPRAVIVVTQGDDQQTGRELEKWRTGQRLPYRLEVVHIEKPGQVYALNAGLEASAADVVCFTDDDCVPRPDWLERLLSHYTDSLVGGVGGRDIVFHGTQIEAGKTTVVGRFTRYGRPIGNHHLELEPPEPVQVDHLKGANMSFRRELLEGFDEALQRGSAPCNDLDVSLGVRAKGYKLVYDPKAIVEHYPAPRYGESTRHYEAAHMLIAEGHNWMYVALKHSRWWQVPAVLAYGFLAGHARAYGLAKAVEAAFRVGPWIALRRLAYALIGKFAGIKTWMGRKWRHGAPARHSDSR